MSKKKKKIRILIPLGVLLLTMVLLAGCRPSTALTRLVDALNALNPSTETTETEEEQEEDTASWNMDPIDEERDDAKIREMDELIGQLLENMDEEEAEAAVRSLYENLADSHEWGTQQYNPDLLNDENEAGALALYIGDHNIRLESGRTNGKGTTLTGTGTEATEGVASGSGTMQSDKVTVTPEEDSDDTEETETGQEEQAGGEDNGEAAKQGEDENSGRTDTDQPSTGEGGPGGGDGDPDAGSSGSQDLEEQGSVVFDSFTGHNIAATGQAAIMVCMLGGADRLVATSPDFNANELAQRAFNGSGQMHYATLWNNLSTDDGSEPMNDTEFAYLLNEVQPDLVIEMSGSNTFSNAQLRQMAERGIGYYPLSRMNTIETMKSVLKSLALDMDETENGTPAMDIYNVYAEWVDNKIDMASSCANIRETVFIDDWDENVVTRFNIKSYNNSTYKWEPTNDYVQVATGAAVIWIGRSYQPFKECLMASNVFDWSACPHERPYGSAFFTLKDFGYGTVTIGASGSVAEWFEFNDGLGQLFDTKPGDYCYISPIYDQLDGTTSYEYGIHGETEYSAQGGLSFINGQQGISEILDSWVVPEYGTSRDSSGLSYGNLCLGYNDNISIWDTVIVKNWDIYDKLTTNPAWQLNNESGKLYATITERGSQKRKKTLYCTLWPLNGTLNVASGYIYDMSYNTSIAGEYDVYVNPTGLGDWTGESPEAILETCWAMAMIQKSDDYSEDDLRQDIHDFYLTFYGLNIDKYGTEMATILAGPAN